ncbi:hypothetical protein M436DRAFT_67053 [Aureobasidium namibiae CBS 147.97]|uniref:C2H2-type domain-containing protein n=1 Tax=Aureobasidium namibiae CBS 147.97 TaxID=1043004 RepID=A0A074WA67_9PEZI
MVVHTSPKRFKNELPVTNGESIKVKALVESEDEKSEDGNQLGNSVIKSRIKKIVKAYHSVIQLATDGQPRPALGEQSDADDGGPPSTSGRHSQSPSRQRSASASQSRQCTRIVQYQMLSRFCHSCQTECHDLSEMHIHARLHADELSMDSFRAPADNEEADVLRYRFLGGYIPREKSFERKCKTAADLLQPWQRFIRGIDWPTHYNNRLSSAEFSFSRDRTDHQASVLYRLVEGEELRSALSEMRKRDAAG